MARKRNGKGNERILSTSFQSNDIIDDNDNKKEICQVQLTIDWRWILLIWILSIVLYCNSFNGDFVMDDSAAIVNNMDLRSNVTTLFQLFQNDFWGTPISTEQSHKSYRPFTVLTFRWNYHFSELNQVPYHLTNVFLYSIVCILATYSSFHLFKNSFQAILTGLLFTCHPIHTESVASLVGRAELLSGIFFFLSFHFYVSSISSQKHQLLRYLISLCLALFSMLSKETGITILGITCAYDVLKYHFKYQWNLFLFPKVLYRCIGSASILGMSLLVRQQITKTSFGPTFSDTDNFIHYGSTFSIRFLSYAYLHFRYAFLLIWPFNLSCDYSYLAFPLIDTFFDRRNFYSFGLYLILCLTILMSYWYKSFPIMMGMMFMIFPFIPSSNIFFPVATVIGERLLFLPSFGFSCLLSFIISKYIKKELWTNKYLFLILFLLLPTYGYRTWTRNEDWSTSISLFKSATQVVPNSCKAFVCLAAAYLEKGQVQKAHECLQKSIKIKSDYAGAYYLLGNLYDSQGDKHNAIKAYLQSVEYSANVHFQPDTLAVALNNLGTIYMKGKQNSDMKKALFYFNQSIQADETRYSAHANIAEVYTTLKDYTRAISHYQKALQIKEVPEIHNNLAIALYSSQMQKSKDSVDLKSIAWHYQRGMEIDPQHIPSRENYAKILVHYNKFKEAKEHYQILTKLNPNSKIFCFNYGQLLRRIRQNALAVEILTSCKKLVPTDIIPDTKIDKEINQAQNQMSKELYRMNHHEQFGSKGSTILFNFG